mmetsp:Transcript_16771/g.38739  ORF Transcript_16771/g.38739 Transcript_16771/m.38739 type:complete len:1295 (+) Transcript_16771:124-4008(+)|eukprot:CAMPEP_0197181534 /NCGR_PEP_ID=MMETSP1423-20130617/5791_1 /TAXON_ID=476441 /ORGANISM="Pseudo-nitzschia heimii, Strain UNC1101" /LENGTH=1294 /DNA_ID=CAMNT_0042631801 /DNA_START=54 /DNA_END=3938 /DNA_ORIENTATION=+
MLNKGLLRLPLVLAACAAVAPASSTPEVTKNLIDWINDLDGGSYNHLQEERIDGKTRGIYATETIEKGEALVEIPWNALLGTEGLTADLMLEEFNLKKEERKRIMDEYYEYDDDDEHEQSRIMLSQCRLIRYIYNELKKENPESSFHSPHLRYLGLLGEDDDEPVMPALPLMWSEEGRSLLEDINDHGLLPPSGLFTPLNHDWFGKCIEDIKNDPLEKKVAAVVAAHGTSATLLEEYGILIPLFDNYHYNHLEKSGTIEPNVRGRVKVLESFTLEATRRIEKGEQIFRSFDNDISSYPRSSTPEHFRNFGIVDTDHFPKVFSFDVENEFVATQVDVALHWDEEEDDFVVELEIYEDDEAGGDIESEIERFFHQEIHRLMRVKDVAIKTELESTMSKREWDAAMAYHGNLVMAMELSIQQIRDGYEDLYDEETGDLLEPDYCPGGHEKVERGTNRPPRCPIWSNYQDLPDEPIDDLDIDYDPGAYGQSEEAYGMCNDEDITEWEDYKPPGDLETLHSQYQAIQFFEHPGTKDMVMRLDSTVQQCSTYRPHYHEFVVHFPARFIETIKRVLFVGGGDSMVLHEVLKYPSLEKVVGLELDQYVVRNSFRYFDTQPHFDNDRVEWWFGDGAKSLLMLPKDYFQSFDLVVVDLSETVMSFQVTDKLSIFETLSLLLKPDGILMKNGEYYMGKMSEFFDHTLQYFEYDVPFICDQGVVIGSNKIDFFDRTMKDHGVELLVLEPQDEINEKHNQFYRFTEYRKNDAREQGHCEEITDSDDRRNAGILMIIEAEGVTLDLKNTDEVEKEISDALKNIGFSIVDIVKQDPSTIVIVTKEGYVTTRLFPEKSYAGIDIQHWANFDMMVDAKDALVKSLGGTPEGTSSFRIVTGGMNGSPFRESDLSKIGPRMENYRDCDPASSQPVVEKNDDLWVSGIEGSLELLEDGVVAAVLCHTGDEECGSVETLSKSSKIKKVVPIYTCFELESRSVVYMKDISKRMADCEGRTAENLKNIGEKISLLVIDNSAIRVMGQVLLSIFTSVSSRKRFFANHRFVALVDDSSADAAWRRNLLVLIREQIAFKPMSFADVSVEKTTTRSKLSILSLHDPSFFFHLKAMEKSFNEKHGEAANMVVEQVFDGLPKPQIGKFNPKKFKADDYDPKPAQEQLAGQTVLGRQSLMQFEIKKNKMTALGPKVSPTLLQTALAVSISNELEFTSFVGKDIGIGDGLVIVAVGKITHAILIWDGMTHIDVNLYSGDEDPKLREKFIKVFVDTLGKNLPLQMTLSDTHPRGIGRVVSFPGHMN